MWVANPGVASTSIATALGELARECFWFACVREPESKFRSHKAHGLPLGDYHYKPQYEVLEPYLDKLELILRFERLAEDWPIVRARTGCGPLPHLNRSAHEGDLIGFDRARYAKDYALWYC